MYINLFLIPYIIILGLLLGVNDCQRNRKLYIILCSIVLVFVAGMRSPEWMTKTYHIDTLNYKYIFESSFKIGWDKLFASAYLRYFGNGSEEDIGFIVLNKAIGFFTHDFHVYSLLADLVFFVPFGVILYRYCTSMSQIMFAFVFYIALVQVFFMGGARQIFAFGFDMMALLAVIDRKRWLAILLFMMGLTIHFSSFLFLAPLLMVWFGFRPNILKVMHLVCFLLFPIVLSMPNELIVFMGDLIGVEKYADYGKGAIIGGATTFIFLIELLSFFCLIAIKRQDIVESKALQIFYVMAPLFTVFAPLIHSNGTMIRISLYYHLFLMLLVPYAIECMFKGKDQIYAYLVAIGALTLLTLSDGGMTYYFYWQK